MAAISNGLFSTFEIGIEVALLSNICSSVVVAGMVNVGVAIGLARLALKLDDIVIEVNGVQLDIGASGGCAIVGTAFGFKGPIIAGRANPYHCYL